MADLQVPPAVGTSGQRLDVAVVNAGSTIWRQSVVIGDPASSGAMGPVTSSFGQLVQVSSGSLISVSGSSGAFAPVTSSGGLLSQITNPTTAVTVNLQTSMVVNTLTSGAMVLSSAGITQVYPVSSSGVNLYTTQGINVALTGSSGAFSPVTSSGGVLVTVVSGGGSTTVSLSSTPFVNVVGTSSGVAVVTSSGGLSMHITDVTGPVTSSWGVTVIPSTGAGGGVTSTFLVLTTVQPIKVTAGNLMGFNAYATAMTSAGNNPVLNFYNFTTANVSIGTSMAFQCLVQVDTTGTLSGADQLVTPPTWFGPNGLTFGTAISVAAGVTSTGIVTVVPVYLSAMYL